MYYFKTLPNKFVGVITQKILRGTFKDPITNISIDICKSNFQYVSRCSQLRFYIFTNIQAMNSNIHEIVNSYIAAEIDAVISSKKIEKDTFLNAL